MLPAERVTVQLFHRISCCTGSADTVLPESIPTVQIKSSDVISLTNNSMDAESDLSEQIYTRALMQLESDQIDSNDTSAKCETDAIVWGAKTGLFDETDRGMMASQRGITEVEFAEIAYRGTVLNGDDVSCEAVIGDYAGVDSLDSYEKKQ